MNIIHNFAHFLKHEITIGFDRHTFHYAVVVNIEKIMKTFFLSICDEAYVSGNEVI